jgi:hypothetical protein
MKTLAEQQKAIDELEPKVERLKALYQQYFMGIEKLPPALLKRDVERAIRNLRRRRIQNTAARYKFQMIVQRLQTYQQYWNRIMRQIENGTYKRDLKRAAQRFGKDDVLKSSGRDAEAALRDVEDEPSVPVYEIDLDDLEADSTDGAAGYDYSAAHASHGHAAHGHNAHSHDAHGYAGQHGYGHHAYDPHAAAQYEREQREYQRKLREYQEQVRIYEEKKRAYEAYQRQQALQQPPTNQTGPHPQYQPPPTQQRPIPGPPQRKLPPPPRSAAQGAAAPSSAAGQPAPAMPSAPGQRPVAPERPAPQRKAPSRARPSRGGAPPRNAAAGNKRGGNHQPSNHQPSNDETRTLYNRYVEARRKAGESTASITYDKLAKSLEKQRRTLQQKHGDRKVDFEVVSKNGRTMIRPVIK